MRITGDVGRHQRLAMSFPEFQLQGGTHFEAFSPKQLWYQQREEAGAGLAECCRESLDFDLERGRGVR